MARPRRKSEAPKLRVIQGGAQALVPREVRPRAERGTSTTRKSLDPVPEADPAVVAQGESPTEPEPAHRVRGASATPQRKWLAAAVAFAAAVLAYLVLRRR